MPIIKLRQQNKLGNHFWGFGYYKKRYPTLPIRLKVSYLYWSLYLWVGNVILSFVLLSDEAFSWTLRIPADVAVLGAGILHRLTMSIPDFGVRIGWNAAWQPVITETKSHLGLCLTDRCTTGWRWLWVITCVLAVTSIEATPEFEINTQFPHVSLQLYLLRLIASASKSLH